MRKLITSEAPLHINRPVFAALGLFDGVHRAHAKLIAMARTVADSVGGVVMVYTFSRNPMDVVLPERAPLALMTIAARTKRLFELGASVIVIQEFDERFANTEPAEFIRSLCHRYNPGGIFVGYNFRFGRNGEGTPDTLSSFANAYGYRLHAMAADMTGGGAVSSTRIRHALAVGDVERANQLLGRSFEMYGRLDRDGTFHIDRGLIVPRTGKYHARVDFADALVFVSPVSGVRINAEGVSPGKKRVELLRAVDNGRIIGIVPSK